MKDFYLKTKSNEICLVQMQLLVLKHHFPKKYQGENIKL